MTAAACVAAPLAARGDTIDRAGPCDRLCLTRTLDDYLRALAARDPRQLRWTVRARYTENGAPLRIGEGLWATAGSIGGFRLVFADPEQSSVAFFGTAVENDSPVILALRLKLAGKRIAEAEHVVARNRAAAGLFAARMSDAAMAADAPPASRATRAELTAAAHAYFDGIETVSAGRIAFAADCNRVENGTQTTNVKDLGAGPFLDLDSPSWRAVLKQGCAASIDSGANAHITEARARRIVVVDEERSVAVAAVIFGHPGTIAAVELPGQPRIVFPSQLRQPFDTLILEAFKLNAEKRIVRVEAVGTILPFGATSGWGR